MSYRGFWDNAQVQRYLVHSIVRFDGKPVFIGNLQAARETADTKLVGILLGTMEQRAYKVYDPAVNLQPVPLGYCNIPLRDRQRVLMVRRLPIRSPKIGLAADNINISQLQHHHAPEGLSMADFLMGSHLADTITGKFPTFNEAMKRLEHHAVDGVAFSRCFAVFNTKPDPTVHLFYKHYKTPVGTVDGSKVKLANTFVHLRERLDEELER